MEGCGVIDLDANATTALAPEVLEAMLPWLRDGHANPNGSYRAAKAARKAIDEAREKVAELIGADAEEIVFTGGGTESVNAALHSLDVLCGEGKALVSAIEHSAVLRYAERLPRGVRRIPVTAGGVAHMTDGLMNGAAFVSVMLANNETGVLQPVAEIAAAAKAKGLPVHTDAIQAIGKIPVNARELGVDLLSLSAHKFYGPKGVGSLYVRRGFRFAPMFYGGGQENGRRSGTENTAGIVAMGAAAELARAALADGSVARTAAVRDAFESAVRTGLADVTVNGDVTRRLPNTSHLSFEGCDAAGLLILLDEAGVACSAGSACMTGQQKPSHVQLAMGISEEFAKSSLRFSFSRDADATIAQQAAVQVIRAVEKLRLVQGPDVGPVTVYT
ncbi:MAG: cysteine desulfurase family protein [Verrucomicrobiota bacterium]